MTTSDQSQFTSQLYELLRTTATGTDTSALRSATSTLNKKFYNTPACVPALLSIACEAADAGVRQLAAVEARKRCEVFWCECPLDVIHQGHALLLTRLGQEPERSVANALARLIAAIALQDVPSGRWPELMPTVLQAAASAEAGQREVAAMTMLYVLQAVTLDDIQAYTADVFNVLSSHLTDAESRAVRITAMESMGEIAGYVSASDKAMVKYFQDRLPAMVAVVKEAMEAGDETSTARGLAVFDELVSGEAPVLNAHMAQFVEFVCSSFANTQLDEEVRMMAGNILILLPLYKTKHIIKLKLVHPILQAVLPVAAEPEDADDDEDEDSPARIAIKCVHAFGMHFPPSQVFPILSATVSEYASNSANPSARRAGMMILALVVDGCADAARVHLDDLVTMVLALMADQDASVRKAACLCMSALGETLSVGTTHHARILPALFSLMHDVTHVEVLRHATNALDTILDGLGEDIMPYIHDLMTVLTQLLRIDDTKMRQVVVGAIGSAASASSEQFAPFFAHVVPMILELMALADVEDTALMLLRGIAIDTMSAMADAVGPEVFRPYLAQTTQLAIESMNITSEPKVKECAYCFFGVLARLYKTEFTPMLPQLVPALMASIDTKEAFFEDDDDDDEATEAGAAEGATVHERQASGEDLFAMGDDGFDSDDNEDDDDAFKVSSAIAEEKATALEVLADLFESTENDFLPYLDGTVEAFMGNTDHYHDGVRKAVVIGLFKILITTNKMSGSATSKWEAGLPLKAPVHDTVRQMTELVMTAMLKMLEEEDDRVVAAEICDAIQSAMHNMGPVLIHVTGHLDKLCNLAVSILEGKHFSQTQDDEDIELDADELAEYDAILIAGAADVVGALAQALGASFCPYATRFLVQLAKYFTPKAQVAERSMAIGTLAEIVDGVKAGVTEWHKGMLDLFQRGLRDPESEVRSNASYGLGLLAQHTNVPYDAREFVMMLSASITSGDLPQEHDNACGAAARILMRNDSWAELADLVPALISTLPMRADFEENATAIDLLVRILVAASGSVGQQQQQAAVALVGSVAPQLVSVIAQYLLPANNMQTDAEKRHELVMAIKGAVTVQAQLQQAVGGLPQELQGAFMAALSS
ncbi:armadillo-type protein [Catenaria anguillulae PL171]|uniref:Armadillo-type protein n=1 Tax=Catenaria anguillulae PL171 TaxID=765915 RepID=A0A1Y2I0R8_9FUNG|nr:armadillo-type protein [Catenaria anguillulae PL171]